MQSSLDTILLKVASRCNINCSYCYVFNMGDDNWTHLQKKISTATVDAFCRSIERLLRTQESIFSIVLHGGEPLLIGIKGLTYLLSSLRAFLPASYPISIQTNGILLTTEILDICSFYRTTVAVSIDGPKEVHDRWRTDHVGNGSFDRALAGIRLLQGHSDNAFLNTGLLAVIDPCSDPGEVYDFFKELKAQSVDFIFRDGNHDRLPLGKSSLDSLEYGRWMGGLLDVYLSDPDPVPVRILDDMMKVLLGGMVSKEGVGVTDFGILIVDTDGSIMKNDTLKSSFNGADKFGLAANIRDICLVDFIRSTEFISYRGSQRPSCTACRNCPEIGVCGGGMMLHRWSVQNGFGNPSVYCADQLYLIGKMRRMVSKLICDHDRSKLPGLLPS
jgi:uncharacterized protein